MPENNFRTVRGPSLLALGIREHQRAPTTRSRYEEFEDLMLGQFVDWLKSIGSFLENIGGSADSKSSIHALVRGRRVRCGRGL